MKGLLYTLLAALALASCSKEEEVVTPPAPKQYTLAISADTGGTVSTEGGLYNEGSKITVTATPDGMYLFKEWSDGSTQNPREITVTSNLTLKASFIKKTYPLAVTVEGEGTVQEEVIIQGSTTETEYNAGTTVRLTATPNEGWVFAGWSGDVVSEELVIEVPIEKGTSVSALFIVASWETLSERYSPINETTGFFKDQEYFSNYPHADIIKETRLQDQSAHIKLYWGFGMSTYVVDYDGDDKPDLLAFGLSMCDDHHYSYHDSKIIFSSNMSYPRLAYDTFSLGYMEFNDFDGDGVSDMLAMPSVMSFNMYNAAEDRGGGDNAPPALPRLYSHKSGNTFIEIGQLGDSHTVTSGDVDNDGDIDFIQLPMPASYNGEPFDFEPSVGTNLGNGFFNNVNLFSDYLHLAQGPASPSNYYATASELFDVNGDGYLDLLLGGPIGATKGCELYPRLSTCLSSPILLLGDGSGQFRMNSRIELNETFHTSRNWTGEVLGFGFTDYDKDGDIDILTTSTRTEPDGSFENGLYYDQYELNLFRNDGSTFTDVTESDIVGSYNSFREFPNFYAIRLIDVDDDGDYDIVPDRVANFGEFIYSKTLHWKNTGGKFERSY